MHDYVLSPEAVQDLQVIQDFLTEASEIAADSVLNELFDAFERLAQWPGMGHHRLDLTDRDVRFWPVGAYLVVYRETRHALQIVAVLHSARDIPEILRGR